jgi:Na+/melibiose symporter-like transporter
MSQVTPTGTTVAVSATRSAWGNRDFRRLWFGSTVSWFGSQIGELALPLLAIVTLRASPGQLGILRGAQFLPFLLATLPLGVLVDRRRRRPLMIGADAGRFLLIGVIPAAVWAGLATMELLYCLAFLAGILTVLYQLADFALLPRVVDDDQLVDGNGRLAASQAAAETSGKGLGGVIVQALSAPVAVLVDAVSYLVSALTLSRLRTAEPPPTPAARPAQPARPAKDRLPWRDGWRDAREGLGIVVRNRYLRPLLGEATTFNFFNEIFILGLLLYAVRDLGLNAAQIGLVFTAGGVGSFLGAWFGPRITGRFGYGRVLLVTLLLGNTAPVAVVASTDSRAVALTVLTTAFAVMGVGIGIANVHAVSLRQSATPAHLHGRVNAGYRLISWGAVPLGASLGGLLAAQLGAHAATLIGACGIPMATVWVAASSIPRLASIQEASV